MKANEAPENIWLSPNEYRPNEPSCFWGESQRTDYDIEYTRTDAFVEKACEFISLNVCDYIDVTYKGGIEHLALQEKFIDALKKYMKGE